MDKEKLPLRPNVCMIVFNNQGKLFLGERAGTPGVWQFPQGGIENGASLEENVLRELHEELGAESSLFLIVKRLQAEHSYEFEETPAYAVGKWRGQAQQYWLVQFKGCDSDINLGRFERELMSFKWCSIEELRSLAEGKRLIGYEKALPEVEEYLNSQGYCKEKA
ncbi:MAG: NUDIX domain-containing protein [SAR324 cluster bacterium]|uniref:NUDIX domain-containing protein n=1 Tax=SAR324 cluster bacterium TaxID=2024889 RepID=A0A7X9IJR5_9DELT|nr:NUDIX domain-containing protein [SAR324 cluster bacterium]